MEISVVKMLTPEGAPITGEQVLCDGIDYHIEQEDDESFTIVLHYKDES